MTAWRKSRTRSVMGRRASESSECFVIGRLRALAYAARISQEQLKQLLRFARTEFQLLPASRKWTIDFTAEGLQVGGAHSYLKMTQSGPEEKSHAEPSHPADRQKTRYTNVFTNRSAGE